MNDSKTSSSNSITRHLWLLIGTGVGLLGVCIALYLLSHEFDPSTPGAGRPLLTVIGLLVIGFVFYAAAWWSVGGFSSFRFTRHSKGDADQAAATNWGTMLAVILLFGLAFRLVLVCSTPIQEIDLYRYIWDGAVLSSGVDPYQYPPAQVIATLDQPAMTNDSNPDLALLARLIHDRPGLERCLRTIHYGHFNSPYPPVSQAVFAVAIAATPESAPMFTYVWVTKLVLMLFDIGTAGLILIMLRIVNWSPLLVVGYWWCPLVLKEFTNSGHLDSVAVFFATFGLAMIAWGLSCGRTKTGRFATGGLLLAFGVAAKIFPLVLFPIWGIAFFKKTGWPAVPISIAVTALAFVMCWPLLENTAGGRKIQQSMGVEIDDSKEYPLTGLEAFSRYWEMNDLAFMIVVENLKEQPNQAVNQPWFLVTSNQWRHQFSDWLRGAEAARGASISDSHVASFAFTRKLLLVVFGLVVLFCCQSIWRDPTPQNLLEKSFLVVAWFWLLSPTQNPWYWIWALSMLPFARARTWFAFSGVLFLYYLRFWCDYHLFATPLFLVAGNVIDGYLGTSGTFAHMDYTGTLIFDFVVPWIEFGPLFVLLFLEWGFRRMRSRRAE